MNELMQAPRKWASKVSVATFIVGVCSLIVYFVTIQEGEPARPWAFWALVVVPLVSGLVGAGFGVYARAWWLTGLNVLLVFAFPLVMGLGTLVLGP